MNLINNRKLSNKELVREAQIAITKSRDNSNRILRRKVKAIERKKRRIKNRKEIIMQNISHLMRMLTLRRHLWLLFKDLAPQGKLLSFARW
jgi:hypothetical protein